MSLPTHVHVLKGSASGKIVASTLPGRTTLLPDEVALRITHSGVCGTDLHHLHDDLVLGHEGIGIVTAVGTGVTKFAAGDRVGFGYVRGGCGACEACRRGDLFYCSTAGAARQYGVSDFDQGSFADAAVWPEVALHRVPDALGSAEAAPFLCAGLTVFTPMKKFGVGKGRRVGVLGLGGLGHLAVGFADKLGAEVVVFSGSEDKRAEALELGAKEFYVTQELGTRRPEAGLDFLVVTATRHPDWNKFLDLMNPFGQIDLLGLTTEELVLPTLPLMLKEISIRTGLTSKPEEVDEILAFAAEHGVRPIVEEFPMSEEGASQAVEKLVNGTIRYRGVLSV